MDYKEIGLKAGLEIHQQLDVGKLFCKCPGYLRSDEPHFSVMRKLHRIAGETGEIDRAVEHEAQLDKQFFYQGYHDTTCLVELDEEPPRLINEAALTEALKIALLLNCEIYPTAQIMRKTVIDGSNTGGFQRTTLIAHDGFIDTSFGKVAVDAIFLEEDSARPVERSEDKVIYKLDRLGIPLVEIATGPYMYNPEQIKEAALKLGEILRACKVKRGIGTIRQDINVSTRGGNKVEIKGFQDPSMMVSTVDGEALRQIRLYEIFEEVKEVVDKKIKSEDVSDIFSKTSCSIIRMALDKQGVVLGAKAPGFVGLFGKELQEGKRFGTEVSYRARMYGVGGIIHSDEDLTKYKFSSDEILAIKTKLDVGEKDAFMLIADEPHKAKKAIAAAIMRIEEQYFLAVPAEVRGALPNGQTEFQRPMPGGERMYPETDLPLLYINRERVNEVKKNLPKLRTELKEELKKKGLNEELMNLVLDGNFDEFSTLMNVYNKDANLVAKMICLWRSEFATKLNKSDDEMRVLLSENVLEQVLESFVQGKITEGDIKGVLYKIACGEALEQALAVERVDDNALEESIALIIKEKPGLRANAYMGLVVSKLGSSVDKRKAMEILHRLVH